MKVAFNILFWNNGDENRSRNVKFSIFKFRQYLNSISGAFDFCFNVFDFSEQSVLGEDARLWIPYPKTEYKKAEKWNTVLNFYKDSGVDYFCGLDADLFFDEYQAMNNAILSMTPDMFFTSDLNDIHNDCIDFSTNTVKTSPVTAYRHVSSLGACFIVPYEKIMYIGGFDERFTVWGVEDDDASSRLERLGLQRKNLPVRILHLPHIPLHRPNSQFDKQVEMFRTDASIIRNK